MFLLVLTLSFFLGSETAKILGVFPAPGYSQFVLAEELMKEVARRGHEVTVISPFRPKNPPSNYKTILTEEVIAAAYDFDLFTLAHADLFTNIKTTYWLGNAITEHTLKNKQVQELLNSNEHFDLVIMEHFFNDAMKAFAPHFDAPMVLFASMGANEWIKEYMGVPMLPSITALTYTSHTNTMSLSERVWNVVGTVYDYLYRHYVYFPVQKQYMKMFFPKLDFEEVVFNASLMLVNSHVTTSESALLPYNMVEIGGFHVVGKPLTEEVRRFLDEATDGAVLFSLGSNLNSADLKEETLDGIFAVFRSLKQRVLWKFEKDLPNKPKNVYISKWLSQRDILAHPNVKLFITHGGLLSTTESIYHGVPMVGIPVFADQRMNMARAQTAGIARVVPFPELNQNALQSAVDTVLKKSEYQKNAKKMSELMKDRPIKPMDLAMYWIEYVIRHKGARFDLPKMSWYQVYMVDILFVFVSGGLVLTFLLKCCFKIRKSGHKKGKTKQQ